MGKLERAVKPEVMVAVSKIPGVRVFNCPTGQGWVGKVMSRIEGFVTLKYPTKVVFGLTVGGSDIIGWSSVVIPPAWVGRRVAVFTALETKRADGGTISPDQTNFLARVSEAGGIACVPRSAMDAVQVIERFEAVRA